MGLGQLSLFHPGWRQIQSPGIPFQGQCPPSVELHCPPVGTAGLPSHLRTVLWVSGTLLFCLGVVVFDTLTLDGRAGGTVWEDRKGEGDDVSPIKIWMGNWRWMERHRSEDTVVWLCIITGLDWTAGMDYWNGLLDWPFCLLNEIHLPASCFRSYLLAALSYLEWAQYKGDVNTVIGYPPEMLKEEATCALLAWMF